MCEAEAQMVRDPPSLSAQGICARERPSACPWGLVRGLGRAAQELREEPTVQGVGTEGGGRVACETSALFGRDLKGFKPMLSYLSNMSLCTCTY